MDKEIRYRLIQDGQVVASVAADKEYWAVARREINHYYDIYSQDGPCHIEFRNEGGKWVTFRE